MKLEFQNILEVNNELLESVRIWRNKKSISNYMFTNHKITKEEHKRWIEKLRMKNTAKSWVIKYKLKPVGLASIFNIDYENKTTDWGFYIANESLRGKGIGSAVLYCLMEYVFEKMKFEKMVTNVLGNNHIAIGLYEKFGFVKEGIMKEKLVRDQKEIDVFLMSIKKEKWNKIKERINHDLECNLLD